MTTASAATPRFSKAERSQARLRMLIEGPATAGKTFTALRLMRVLTPKIAVIIAGEIHGVLIYAGHEQDGVRWDFAKTILTNYSPEDYSEAIRDAAREGYEGIIIDQLSSEWNSTGGILQMIDSVDNKQKMSKWKIATPLHDAMLEEIRNSPAHIIALLRSKMTTIVETVEGKMKPISVGMEPIQRNDTPYEFHIALAMDHTHTCTVIRSKCLEIDGLVVQKPGPELMKPIIEWLSTGKQIEATSVSGRISTAQHDRVGELLIALRWKMERISKDFPQKYGVTELMRFTHEQAETLIRWLEAQLAAMTKRSAPAAAAPSAATNGTPAVQTPAPPKPAPTSAPVAPTTAHVPAPAASGDPLAQPITQVQVQALKDLKAELEPHGLTTEAWKGILAKRGVDSAMKLTRGQADELVKNLAHKANALGLSVGQNLAQKGVNTSVAADIKST